MCDKFVEGGGLGEIPIQVGTFFCILDLGNCTFGGACHFFVNS